MARISFPSSPTNGQTYTIGSVTYTYNSTTTRWAVATMSAVVNTDSLAEGTTNLYYTDARARTAISVSGSLTYNSSTGEISGAGGSSGASVTVSETAPTSPSEGDLWYDPSTLETYIYYLDANSNYYWVSVDTTAASALDSPAGTVTSATSGNITPDISITSQINAVGLTGSVSFLAPTGSAADGQRLLFRIKDNGTVKGITWNSIYRSIGTVLPLTTVANKILYVGCVFNSADATWDVIAATIED